MADEQFLSHAVLDALVPHASDVNLEDALTSSSRDDSEDTLSPLSTIRQRDLLFFDELVPVYVVLRLVNCSESSLRSQLPRLSVKLEAFAVSSEAPGDIADGAAEKTKETKDLIYSGGVHDPEDPLVIVHEVEDDDEIDNYVFVVWKAEAFLNRPRVRFQQPSVLFVSSATLNPQAAPDDSREDEYLPSLVPGSINVFQSLATEGQGNSQFDPYLPTSRLVRVVPASQPEDGAHHIQQQTCRPYRVIPIASARVRYSRLNTYSTQPATLASVDFEVTPFTGFEVVLREADVSLAGGKVENLTQLTDFTPPITCQPRDDVTLLYKLTAEDAGDGASSTTSIVSVLSIHLAATILVSDDCQPRVVMQWNTNVDFSMPLNPTFGGPSQVLQRSNRPANLSVDGSQGTNTPPAGRSAANRRSYVSPDLGVTVSFSGPAQVEVGKAFRWDVFIVNRSDKARRFAMAAIPRRKRTDARKHTARPSSSSSAGAKGTDMAEAVADENIVYAMQKNAALLETELISLSTDIRIGPLHPGTCHAAELKLLPLAPGPLHMEAVRVVDLATNDSIDIRSLPDIVSYPNEHTTI